MGNQCNQWGCTNKESTDSNGNKLRGGFCSLHGYYNAKYNIWVGSSNTSEHDLKILAEIEKSSMKSAEKAPLETSRKTSYTKCTMCSNPVYQCGLCYDDFNNQMACKRQGVSGMFKQYK